MNSRKKIARMAGFLYLMFLVTLIFAEDAVRSKLIVFGDGAATPNNIIAYEGLFRIGFMSDLLSGVLFL